MPTNIRYRMTSAAAHLLHIFLRWCDLHAYRLHGRWMRLSLLLHDLRWWACGLWLDHRYGSLCSACNGIGREQRPCPPNWRHAVARWYWVPCPACHGRRLAQ